MADLLETRNQMKDLEQTLSGLGVPLDKLEEVLSKVNAYQSFEDDLVQARKKQFLNDAWKIQIMSGKLKESQGAEYLREFTEHVLIEAFKVLDINPSMPIVEIVDQIEPLEREDCL